MLAALLTLWLILGFWPLSGITAAALCLLVLFIAGLMLWRQSRQRDVEIAVADDRLPPEDFRGAVVLVCGDSASLFSGNQPRETAQGWYLPVDAPGQLAAMADYITSQRPALLPQVSMLLAVVPEQYTSAEDFTSHFHGWQRALLQCRRVLKCTPPLWTACWVSHPNHETEWFSIMPGQGALQACIAGNDIQPLAEWFREQPSRLVQMQWLDSLLMWQEKHITPLTQSKPCRAGICLTPVTAQPDNLWAQHLIGLTTLPYVPLGADVALPLPDTLLAGLPRRQGVSRRLRLARAAGMIVAVFLALALLASFLNNQRLIRTVGDHLTLWAHLSGEPAEPKVHARAQLIADRTLLDGWQRGGEPLRLGLGLYQGMRLFAPVDASINSWAPPPPPPPVIQQIVEGPKTVRLDSLSLFDSGKSDLKTGSTKVLVNALVGIKAKPGWLIVVAGYTDDTGNPALNQRLSLKRAESVRDWMRDTGDVDESCFAVQGFGQSRPIESNDTPEGRAANRRVEISLVPQADACQAPDAIPPSSQDGDGNHEEKE
ncbi:OmpA family protein [Pantoea endophytica]